MTAVGYTGRLSTVAGHLEARVDAAKRAEKHAAKRAEIERARAEKELQRFAARWGNGKGPDLTA